MHRTLEPNGSVYYRVQHQVICQLCPWASATMRRRRVTSHESCELQRAQFVFLPFLPLYRKKTCITRVSRSHDPLTRSLLFFFTPLYSLPLRPCNREICFS